MVANGIPTSATSWTPSSDLEVSQYRWWVIAVITAAAGSLKSGGATAAEFFVGGRTTVLIPVGSTTDTTPDFTWLAVTGATSYRLFVQRLGTTPVIVINQTLTTTAYMPTTPLSPGTYRTWLQAIRANGEVAPWSKPMDFTVTALGKGTPEPLESLDSLFAELLPWFDTTVNRPKARRDAPRPPFIMTSLLNSVDGSLHNGCTSDNCVVVLCGRSKVAAKVLKRVNRRFEKRPSSSTFLAGPAEEFDRAVGFFEAWVSVFDDVEIG